MEFFHFWRYFLNFAIIIAISFTFGFMYTEKKPTQLVFVGGPPRSGTTLMENVLDSHPDILGVPEFKHLWQIIDLRNELNKSVSRQLIHDFCDQNQVDSQIKYLIDHLMISIINNTEVNKKGAQILAEKTPMNVLVFQELAELYPYAKFVLVLRDPRGIINSLMHVKMKAIENGAKPPHICRDLSAAIMHTKKHVQAGLDFKNNHTNRLFTCFYEDLVLEPDQETKRICEFLEVPWSDSMLSPGQKKHLNEATMTNLHNAHYYDRNKFNRNPDKSNVGKWKTELPLKAKFVTAEEFSGYPLLNTRYSLKRYLAKNNKYKYSSILYYLGQKIKSQKSIVKSLARGVIASYK